VKEYGAAEDEEETASADASQDLERAQSNDQRFNLEAFSRLTSPCSKAGRPRPSLSSTRSSESVCTTRRICSS